jgi:K+-transporting ATPase KdpF subunit
VGRPFLHAAFVAGAEAGPMDWENLLALIAAVALVGYLVYTLVRPERF